MNLLVGIDDTGTGSQVSEGWSYFLIPENERDAFDTKVTPLMALLKETFFHAKNFKTKEQQIYVQFLSIIKDSVENASYGAAGCVLNSMSWKNQLRDFLSRITIGALSNNGITNPKLVESIVSFVEPICTLTSLLKRPGDNLFIEIDTDVVKEDLAKLTHSIGKSNISATQLLLSLCNGYCQTQFPESPRVSDIKALEDSKSTIIQAADVIGNFQTAYIFDKLGDTSATRKLKSTIFESVVKDGMEAIDFKAILRLQNNDAISRVATDLELIQHARLKLLIESVLV